jgi:predicted nucleic acid-binding protein
VKWLLDTNVISENVSHQANENVRRWIAAQTLEDIGLSAVTLAELIDGIERTADERRKNELTAWLDAGVISQFRNRTVPVSVEILLDWLGLTRKLGARGRPQAAADLLIASTCRVHDLTLATRNTRDFANTGITVYNPWTDKTQQMEAP